MDMPEINITTGRNRNILAGFIRKPKIGEKREKKNENREKT